MIVVIADDLTGAGEIGGIGLACGFKVEVQRGFCSGSNADLLVIDTDTRSCSPEKAGQVMRDVAGCLKNSVLPVEWIYKKTDSVLRGPVGCELEALRDVMGASRVLLVPSNPSKGRILRDGNYFINEKLLSETDFANDPEYPAITSEILKFPTLAGSCQLHLLESGQMLPSKGLMIGQAKTSDDLLQWSEEMDEQTMVAGAGEFFDAILRNKGFSNKRIMNEKEYRLGKTALFVCGSSSDNSRRALTKAEEFGMRVCRMPEALFQSGCAEDKSFQQWSNEIIVGLKNDCTVVMAIDREIVGSTEFACKLRGIMATLVQAVSRQIPLAELFVEGGATASEIVNCFGWRRFEPFAQLGPGVVRMRVLENDTICLTVKPGSYPWPKSIWKT